MTTFRFNRGQFQQPFVKVKPTQHFIKKYMLEIDKWLSFYVGWVEFSHTYFGSNTFHINRSFIFYLNHFYKVIKQILQFITLVK